MLRKIIKIDADRCNGCGLCASACHEGAIDIVDGKAKLMREHFCDGLGDCLPACPMNAISFEMREAPGYDEAAVLAAKREHEERAAAAAAAQGEAPNALDNWPVQLKLVSAASPVFHEARRDGVCRKAHADSRTEQRQVRHAHADVRPVLRRHGIRRISGHCRLRPRPAAARRDHRRRRRDFER